MNPRTSDSDDNPAADETTDHSPVAQLIELCVYAPIGLALDARSLLPGLVERGRQQVGVARMVGEFAVKWGSVQLEAKVGDAQDQAMGLLRATGLAPVVERDRGAPEGSSDTFSGTDETALREDAPMPNGSAEEPDSDPVASVEPTAAEPTEVEPTEVVDEVVDIDVETLAIPDYDNLSASQVVPRLEGLTDDELDAVGHYEASHRSRNTILNKVAQLQGGG